MADERSDDKAISPVINNPWEKLRRFTDARIGMGRAGVSLPTRHLLDFQLAHAAAQDAVHKALDAELLVEQLRHIPGERLKLHSSAVDRREYLQRPDFGRRLDDDSSALLQASRKNYPDEWDLAIIIVDGLSALAIEKHAAALLDALLPRLQKTANLWSIAPICLVEQGRVAIGDPIGELLQARCVLVLIGERPGLSSPDSMGLYLTWNPEVGKTDAQRNCISNIRKAGLSYLEASRRADYLLTEARLKKLSGVKLKDYTDDQVQEISADNKPSEDDSTCLLP